MAFQFLPGERVLYAYGWPGPDTTPCQVIIDDGGETVTIEYQFKGKAERIETKRSNIMWMRGTPTSERYAAYCAKSQTVA